MELQLTKRQESIILLYLRSPELNMSMIAEKLGITKSSVSQALNKLEEEDLLHRSINELNRREITLTLGKQGEELHSQFREFEDMIVKNYISKLELEEFQAARDALVKLERIIEKGEKN
nr:MarR family transcriptional regulator [Bacillus piscicola]